MKHLSRWLAPAGCLAVGFLAGRYSAEPNADLVPVAVADTVAEANAVAEAASVADVQLRNAEPISLEFPLGEPGQPSTQASPVNPAKELAVASESGSATASPSTTMKRCVGTWKAQTSHGPRRSTLAADGTGVIHAELDWVAALFYGQKMTLHVDWVIDEENALMIHTVTAGEPEENVAALLRDFGSVKEYKIDELTDDKMVLVDPGDGEVITWNRADSDATL